MTDRFHSTMFNLRKSFLCSNFPMSKTQCPKSPPLPEVPVKCHQRTSFRFHALPAKDPPYIDQRNIAHRSSLRRNTGCALPNRVHLEILRVPRVTAPQIGSQYQTPSRMNPLP